jgi:hypothetical protein
METGKDPGAIGHVKRSDVEEKIGGAERNPKTTEEATERAGLGCTKHSPNF